MMSMWHLVWIVPVVGFLCFCAGAFLAAGKAIDEESARRIMCLRCPHNPKNKTATGKDGADP